MKFIVKIMFVCTGNICRSAMAHWMMKDKLQKNNINDVEVCSSGIYAQNGDTPTYNAIETMEEFNIDMKKHRATNTMNSDIANMDLIFGMTKSHKDELIYLYPNLKDKIFTLKEYVNYEKEGHDSINIKDPWGFDISTYRACGAEIDECLDLLINKIKEQV